MNHITKLLVAITVTSATACGGDNQSEVEPFWDILCPEVSYASSNIDAENFVVNSTAELNNVWAMIDENSEFTMPSVDFSQGSVIVVYGGARGSGGHSVEVTGIETKNGQVFVSYDNATPSSGCATASVQTHPFCIVQTDFVVSEPEFLPTAKDSCDSLSG